MSAISIPSKPYSLVTFFVLAFGISWAVWVPSALASYGFLSFHIDPILSGGLGAIGPSLAALITTAIFEGRSGFSSLFKRLLTWRVGFQWYLFVLLWPAASHWLRPAFRSGWAVQAPTFHSRPL